MSEFDAIDCPRSTSNWAMSSLASAPSCVIGIGIACWCAFGCGDRAGPPSTAVAATPETPELDLEPEPVVRERAPVAGPHLPECADGRALYNAVFGQAMRTCGASVPSARARVEAGEDFVGFAERWSEAERTAAAGACAAWGVRLRGLQTPRCADHPPFRDAPVEDILAALHATVALQVGALDDTTDPATGEALVSAAEGLLALARGNTPGLVVGTAEHFASEAERWTAWTDAAAPLRARRDALRAGMPTAGHRWEVHKAQMVSLGVRVEDDAFAGHAFVLIDAPKFTDDVFDTKRVPPEVWEVVIDDLRRVRCDGAWEPCVESLEAVSKGYVASVDEKVMRELFWSSAGAFSDLDEPKREALDAFLCSRAARFFVVPFSAEAMAVRRRDLQ